MLKYHSLTKRPAHFHRLTGLTFAEFDQVMDKFRSVWQQYERQIAQNPKRQRKFGGGRHPEMDTLEDKVLFILVYVRMYPLLFIQGILFGIDESNSCTWMHRLLPMLDEALGYMHKRPGRRNPGRNLTQLLEDFPELKELGILGDGVERPKRRPKNRERQKKAYSGKKKRHTNKNIILTNPETTEVVYLGTTREGNMHDKKAMDKEELKSEIAVKMGVDLGFEGLEIPKVHVVLPIKKPKGQELTGQQKYLNTVFARRRIRVEHAIAGIKRSRSTADIYRNIKTGTDDLLMSIACGLHNLRVAHRYAT